MPEGDPMSGRRRFFHAAASLLLPPDPRAPVARTAPEAPAWPAPAELPTVEGVDPGRLMTEIRRVLAAAAEAGGPIRERDLAVIEGAHGAADVADLIQRVLDPLCFLDVHINPELRVKVARGPARPRLVQGTGRMFLVKVRNEAGSTSALRARVTGALAEPRWLDARVLDRRPLAPTLSGLALEYRLVRLLSREAGALEASLAFDVGQGTQDIGFRNEVPILFDCLSAGR